MTGATNGSYIGTAYTGQGKMYWSGRPEVDTVIGEYYKDTFEFDEKSLIGDFYSVKGASNSVRNGYIPLAKKLEKKLKKSSNMTYYALTKNLGQGLYARLIVIKDKSKNQIMDVRYDEYFADSKNKISDKNLKECFRQSKYASRTYSIKSGQNFRKILNNLTRDILTQQKLKVTVKDPSFQSNYSQFTDEMTEMLIK